MVVVAQPEVEGNKAEAESTSKCIAGAWVMKYIFPACIVILNVGAAIVSVINKDYKTAIYWTAAAVLNAAAVR